MNSHRSLGKARCCLCQANQTTLLSWWCQWQRTRLCPFGPRVHSRLCQAVPSVTQAGHILEQLVVVLVLAHLSERMERIAGAYRKNKLFLLLCYCLLLSLAAAVDLDGPPPLLHHHLPLLPLPPPSPFFFNRDRFLLGLSIGKESTKLISLTMTSPRNPLSSKRQFDPFPTTATGDRGQTYLNQTQRE